MLDVDFEIPGEPAMSVAWVKTYPLRVATCQAVTDHLFVASHPGD